MNDLRKLFESHTTKIVLSTIAVMLIALIIFSIGMFVGFRKANFSYRLGENYSRNFGGPRMGMMDAFGGRDFTPGFGAVGMVLKIEGKTIYVKDKDTLEKIIITDDKTSIVRGREKILITDIAVDDAIVTIGTPNESGQIVAKLIRVMPAIQSDDGANFGPGMHLWR